MRDGVPGPGAFDPLAAAIERLSAGGVVAYPTETLYGVAADARSEAAVAGVRGFKGRDPGRPLSILVADAASLDGLGCELGPDARRLLAAFWPGPLTVVLRCDARFASGVAGPDGTVGVRCSPHPVASRLAARAAAARVGPLTATSLNRSGEPAARTRSEARAAIARGPAEPSAGALGAPWLLDVPGAPEPAGLPSTVVDAARDGVRVLREGAISREALRAVLGGAAPETAR